MEGIAAESQQTSVSRRGVLAPIADMITLMPDGTLECNHQQGPQELRVRALSGQASRCRETAPLDYHRVTPARACIELGERGSKSMLVRSAMPRFNLPSLTKLDVSNNPLGVSVRSPAALGPASKPPGQPSKLAWF